jgi:hypothetical protein
VDKFTHLIHCICLRCNVFSKNPETQWFTNSLEPNWMSFSEWSWCRLINVIRHNQISKYHSTCKAIVIFFCFGRFSAPFITKQTLSFSYNHDLNPYIFFFQIVWKYNFINFVAIWLHWYDSSETFVDQGEWSI